MVCTTYPGGVTVCRPSDRFLRKEVRYCPVDECKTEFAVRYEAWHGATFYCCKCGDSWCDEGMYRRPFKRGWRKQAIAHHRDLWDRARHGNPPTFQELYPDEFDAAVTS